LRQGKIVCCTALAATLLAGCFGRKEAKAPVPGTSAEPDKVLYEKSLVDMKHGRYGVGRLGLQTLINTYPDSEYLAKAKLAIGDSYYKEGGTAGMKQAIVEYKDFITFFPFLDESAYAQLQIAMAHYRQMEKPDRDHLEAVQAEAEFQTFLEKYPNSPLAPQGDQHLREVQEVLAEGNFRVASFYYIRGAYRAAGARLLELTNRYPLYSQADQANWMLGQIYEKGEHNDIAAKYYSRIVKDYPLSAMAGDAKAKLTKFGVPVPPADPTAVARMQQEQAANRPGMIKRSMSVLKSTPDVSMAARSGAPTMTPASESGDETLGMALQPNSATAAPSGVGVGNTAAVETITPGSPEALPQPPATTTTPATPGSGTDAAQPAADAAQPASGTAPASPDQAANSTDSGTTSAQAQPANASPDSSSKKKKGLKKIFPF
jgi:outer membrane protein assembly factor BamD